MLIRFFFILLIIISSIGYSLYQTKILEDQLSVQPSAVLKNLPLGSFQTLDGAEFSVHNLFSDPITLLVVHFWGTWCAPCENELPDFLNFIKRFEGRTDIKFVLVAVNDDIVKIRKHLKMLAIPKSSIIWLLDNKNIHRDIYGTTRVPETYVFASNKLTLKKYLGPQEWNKTLFFQTFNDFIQISQSKL
jgi:cytochrome c biogenesis protein CcmG/thiol:disulfide interchange protein DsbE